MPEPPDLTLWEFINGLCLWVGAFIIASRVSRWWDNRKRSRREQP